MTPTTLQAVTPPRTRSVAVASAVERELRMLAVSLDRLPLRGLTLEIKFGAGNRIRAVVSTLITETVQGVDTPGEPPA